MSDPSDNEQAGRITLAEELFAEFLERRRSGGAPPSSPGAPPDASPSETDEFEDLCDEHPELEAELRRMRAGWHAAARFFGPDSGASLEHRVSSTFGDAALPLAADGGSDPDAPRYDVRGEVARGGMGVILEVWDRDLRRRLAMKTLRSADPGSSPPNPRLVSRFLEEAQVTGQLEHPSIVPVHELGLDSDGRVYFTMPLIRGRHLGHVFDLARRGAEGWTQTRALNVLLRVSEAMASAHAKGVLHRDLKPANVMVGPYEETYVMDWGLARVLGTSDPQAPSRARSGASEERVDTLRAATKDATPDSPLMTHDGDVVGTPAYMSPEQARGDLRAVSERSDVYSLGAMLYELLTGLPPYAEANEETQEPRAQIARILAGRPAPVHTIARDVPVELAAICERAMAYAPDERYSSMLAFAQDLRAFLEMRVVGAYRTGAVAELSKWVQRNKALALTGAAAVAVLVAGLLLTWGLLVRVQESERLAQEERARVLGLSDLKRVAALRTRADELWPSEPERVPQYDAWLEEAQTLLERAQSQHEPTLLAMRQEAEFLPAAGGEGEWRLASPEAQWHHDALAELIDAIHALYRDDEGEAGPVGDIEERRHFASVVTERTLTGPDAARAWREACDGVRAAVQYAGLELEPQLGLLPLGRDPRSGLWEFADLRTGAVPRRTADGTLQIGEETGLVFVLLPAGRFYMGSQSEDPDGPNYDPEARTYERPVHEREIDAFLISKYEMTQGQWARFTGDNPSHYYDGSKAGTARYTPTLAHPVENASWFECHETLERLGMRIPSEAEWEYAARAGTETPWWTGFEKESLEGAANIADSAATRGGANWPDIQDWPNLDDGFVVHAPVGTYRPNPFGLHDVHGNVQEFCADDWIANYGKHVGLEDPPDYDANFTVFRGGNFGNRAYNARSAYRNSEVKSSKDSITGIRPARDLR